jgi:hypothetical protein
LFFSKNELEIEFLVVQNVFWHPKNQWKLTENHFEFSVVQNNSNKVWALVYLNFLNHAIWGSTPLYVISILHYISMIGLVIFWFKILFLNTSWIYICFLWNGGIER